MKIRPVRAELLHAKKRTEGQTDVTKPIVASRNFAGAPKKLKRLQYAQRTLFVCFGIFSEKKNRHLSVRHCNGDVIIVCRLDTEFFNTTCTKFDLSGQLLKIYRLLLLTG